jgi:hypothetical protein
MLRCTGAVMGVPLAFCLAVAGCVDPKSDYQAYLSRTAAARAAAEEADAGAVASAAPDAAFQQTYLMACLAGLFGGNVNDAMLFASSLTYTPTSGGGGQLGVTDTPLVVGARRLTQTVGSTVTAAPTPVAPSGTATVVLPDSVVPAAANPTGMGDIVFDNDPPLQADFIFVPTADAGVRVCAGLVGRTDRPVVATLTAQDTPCIFIPLAPTDELPQLTEGEFHCP